MYTHADPEIAVASTKSYTSQFVLLILLAIYMAEQINYNDSEFIQELKEDVAEIPSKLENILKDTSTLKRGCTIYS